ncbi:hypothetical protein ABZ671_00865 [Micromonospora sp. NPDC006766]|uniref:hypothetical protein n=1 Tax=Micromonospora sp. NPDC006766 TaxID=3154778 RepID=UPI0033DA6ABD
MADNSAHGLTAVITERRASAPPQVQQDRAEAVHRLDRLGMIDAAQGHTPDSVVVGYDLTIAGMTLPVLAYEVASTELGPQLTVTMAVDQVTVGGPTAPPTVGGRPLRPVRVWEPPAVDPRADIPGWQPDEQPEASRG